MKIVQQKGEKMMKMLSLFSGIGAFEAALDNIGIDFELVGYCEIDKYASKSYSAIHGVPESMNYGDITKIDEKKLPKDIDLITYGFPCQDISLAGKQKGLFNEDGSQTRSGLFFEALRIIEETKPKIAIAENVKNLVGKKFKEQFEIVLSSLEQAGYNNYWKVLNAKDYGIPQNRERVFIVSIRKDIDTGVFEFPEGYELKLRLKDLLEDGVDEKFYLSDKMFNYAFNMVKEAKGIGFSDGVDGSYINPYIAQTIGCRSAAHQRSGTTNYVSDSIDEPLKVSDMKNIIIGGMQKNQSVKTDGICTTLTSSMGCGGGYVPMVTEQHNNQIPCKFDKMPDGKLCSISEGGICDIGTETASTVTAHYYKGVSAHKDNIVIVKTNNSKGYDTAEPGDYINIERLGSTTRRGRVGHGVSQTLDTKENHCTVDYPPLRIRKLTPKECFRLMGFSDEDFEQAQSVNSNTQLYKQAGNSIVVDVLEELFCMMFDEEGNFFV